MDLLGMTILSSAAYIFFYFSLTLNKGDNSPADSCLDDQSQVEKLSSESDHHDGLCGQHRGE